MSSKEDELNKLLESLRQDSSKLYCPFCEKFQNILNFKITGIDETNQNIETTNLKEIVEFEGYTYQCKICKRIVKSKQLNLDELKER